MAIATKINQEPHYKKKYEISLALERISVHRQLLLGEKEKTFKGYLGLLTCFDAIQQLILRSERGFENITNDVVLIEMR